MKTQQDDTIPDLEGIPTATMMNCIAGDTEEALYLQSKRALEDEIKTLHDGMDAMVSDIAISEALAEENHKSKEKAEQTCLELARKVDDLSRMLQDQNQHQAGKESPSGIHTNAVTKLIQAEVPSKSTRADIEASMNSQFRKREVELMEQCQEYSLRTDRVELLLKEAETRIAALQGQNHQQITDLKNMAAKQDQLEAELRSNDSSQTEKIDQLQSLVKYYKANSERVSRDFKDLKKQIEVHQRTPTPTRSPVLSATTEQHEDMTGYDDESEGWSSEGRV